MIKEYCLLLDISKEIFGLSGDSLQKSTRFQLYERQELFERCVRPENLMHPVDGESRKRGP